MTENDDSDEPENDHFDDERSVCSCDNIGSAQSDDSDVDSDRDIEKPPLHIQLAQWAARHSVTQNVVGSLL